MLYPDFNELLNLQYQAKKLGSFKDQSSSAISGESTSKRYGSGLEFAEVREYVFGDDIRNIDWRVTARTGTPHSKLFKVESEQTINIVVDMNSNMHFGTRSTFKSVQASKAAALIAWFFNQSNNKVGGIIFGDKEKEVAIFHPSKAKQSLLRLLQNLSIQEVGSRYVALDHALSRLGRVATSGSRIYVISDFANFDRETIAGDIKRFREKGCKISFIQIIDHRDYDIPPIGQISFLNMAGNQVVINTDSSLGRKKYFELWEKNQKKIKQLTNEMGVKFIRIKTSDDVFLKLLGKLH